MREAPKSAHPGRRRAVRVYQAVGLVSMLVCSAVAFALWLTTELPIEEHSIISAYIRSVAAFGVATLLALAVRQRFSGRATGLWAAVVRGLPDILGLITFYFWVPGAVTLADYLVLPHSGPLVDERLARFDEWLGLSHPVSYRWFEASGWLPLFARIYASVDWQVQLMVAYYVLWRRDLFRLWQYVAVVAFAGAVSVAFLWLGPAEGPYVWYAGQYANPPPFPPYLHELRLLRQGQMAVFDVAFGFLNFPSFHTVFALLLIRGWRDAKWLFPFFAVLNVLVVVSTIPVGWHYLLDIVGGVVWTGASIGVVEACVWLRARRAPTSSC